MATAATMRSEELRILVLKMCEEIHVLRDCLVAAGILSHQQYHAQLHRRRFTTVRAAHPCLFNATLVETIHTTELANALTSFLRLHELPPILAASCRARLLANDSWHDRLVTPWRGHVYVCGGFDGESRLDTAERFDAEKNQWEPLPRMLDRRSGSVGAVMMGYLYVCGGFDGETSLSSAQRFDPELGVWETLPPMSERRSGAAGTAMMGRLYVCGGYDGQDCVNSAEQFSPEAGQWEPLPGMAEKHHDATCAVLRGCMYICGGRGDGQSHLSSAERFDPLLSQWEALPPMSMRRTEATSAALAGCLYVCGGFGASRDGVNALSSAERFDPEVCRWEALPRMLEGHIGATSTVIMGRLYVVGGLNQEFAERFNPELGQWEALPPMSGIRYRASIVVIAGRLCVCGGLGGPETLNSAERFDPELGRWEALPQMLERRSGATYASLPNLSM